MPGRFEKLEFRDERKVSEETDTGLQSIVTDSRGFRLQAVAESRWGRFDAALQLFTRALQEDRTALPAWVGQVQMLVQLDECHEARVWSDKALELFRGNGELLAAKAQACTRLNDFRTALASSDGSLQAPGSSPWRWIVRGETLLAKGEKQFEPCFQKALVDAAADWFDNVLIARVYMYYHRVTNALGYLQRAIEREPGHGYTWFEMGNCQKQLALAAAARSSYEHCLDLRPDFREAQSALQELSSGQSLYSQLGGLWRRWRGS